MTHAHDDLARLIGTVDQLGDEQAPAPGSDRYQAILSAATTERAEAPAPHRTRGRLRAVAGAAAVVVVLAVSGVVVERLTGEQSATAAVRSALEPQQEVESFEAIITAVHDGKAYIATARVSGDDGEVTATEWPPEPDQPPTMMMVGNLVYEISPDGCTVRPRAPGDAVFEPSLGEVSQALIEALEEADITRAGNELIAGSLATRYDVVLNDRSRQMFVGGRLRMPADMERLTVWIAEDRLRQVDMTLASGDAIHITFFNLGGDITISPPTGNCTMLPTPSPDPDPAK